jgi:RNA polymerase primary sigma factor
MLHEIGREPTPEELAEKLMMPLEKVRKVLKIAMVDQASRRRSATRKTATRRFRGQERCCRSTPRSSQPARDHDRVLATLTAREERSACASASA